MSPERFVKGESERTYCLEPLISDLTFGAYPYTAQGMEVRKTSPSLWTMRFLAGLCIFRGPANNLLTRMVATRIQFRAPARLAMRWALAFSEAPACHPGVLAAKSVIFVPSAATTRMNWSNNSLRARGDCQTQRGRTRYRSLWIGMRVIRGGQRS
jgi:hypothetical protein